jgi:biotin carboxyl carrier protein
MEVVVRWREREERVRIRRTGETYEVVVGDRVHVVDAAPAGDYLYSLLIDGAQREVAIRPLPEGKLHLSAGTLSGTAEVVDPLTYLAQQSAGGRSSRRSKKVTAYMPGRVVAVLVQEGETVTAGQSVLVLEAMKMQNEILAEHDGVVSKIFAAPGQAVEGGDPLFEME